MSTQRPTPETDSAFEKINWREAREFSRKLERQRDEARERADELHKLATEAVQTSIDLGEFSRKLIAQNDALKSLIEKSER